MKIPAYQEQAQSRPEGLPALQPVGGGAFGEAIGRGVQDLAKGVEQLADVQGQFRHEADVANVNDGIATLTKYRSDSLAQLKQKYGKDAVAMSGPILESISKMRQNLAENTMKNSAQRQLFMLHSEPVLTMAHEATNDWITTQVEVGKTASFQAQHDESLRAISNDPSGEIGDKTFKTESEKMRGVIGAEVNRKLTADLPKDQADIVHSAHYNAWLAEATGRRLDVLAARHDAEGIQHFWEQPGVKASLGKLAGHYEALVDETVRKERSYVVSQSILRNFPLVPDDPDIHTVNETGALDAVDAPGLKLPAEERERVRTLVREGIRDRKAGQDQTNQTMFNRALAGVFAGGINAVEPNVKKYLENPNNGGDMLWARIHRVARALAEEDYNAPPSLQQIAIAGRLRADMAENWAYWSAQDPGAVYMQFAGKGDSGLSNRQLQEAYGELAQTKKEAQARAGQGIGPVAYAEILRQGRNAGLLSRADPKTWSDEQGQIFNKIANEVLKKEMLERRKTKEAIGYDKYQEWVGQEVKQGGVPSQGRLFGDRNVRKVEYDINPELQKRGLWIPDDELNEIRTELQRNGLKGTYENVVEMYRLRRQGE